MKYSEVLEKKVVFDASGIDNPHAYDWQRTTEREIYYPVMSSLNDDIQLEQTVGYSQCLADMMKYIAESTRVSTTMTASMMMGKINASFASIHAQIQKRKNDLDDKAGEFFGINKKS